MFVYNLWRSSKSLILSHLTLCDKGKATELNWEVATVIINYIHESSCYKATTKEQFLFHMEETKELKI